MTMAQTPWGFFPVPEWGQYTDEADASGDLAAYDAIHVATDLFLHNLTTGLRHGPWEDKRWYPEISGLVTTTNGAGNTDFSLYLDITSVAKK